MLVFLLMEPACSSLLRCLPHAGDDDPGVVGFDEYLAHIDDGTSCVASRHQRFLQEASRRRLSPLSKFSTFPGTPRNSLRKSITPPGMEVERLRRLPFACCVQPEQRRERCHTSSNPSQKAVYTKHEKGEHLSGHLPPDEASSTKKDRKPPAPPSRIFPRSILCQRAEFLQIEFRSENSPSSFLLVFNAWTIYVEPLLSLITTATPKRWNRKREDLF